MAAVLAELDGDVKALLWAGHAAAIGHAGLKQHGAAAAELSAQVPVLAKVAELVDAVETGGPKALLQLSAAVCQVSAAQLQAAPVTGELAPFEERSDAAVFRAAPAGVLYALIEALGSKKKPPEALEGPSRESAVAQDPRLWPAVLGAFERTQVRHLATALASRAGPGLLPALTAAFKPKGKAEDAARLTAIAGIRGPEGEALYRECLAKGSAPVRLAALEALATLGPERYAEVLLPYYDALAADTRRECFDALCLLGTRPAIERLLALCCADRSLGNMVHNRLAPEARPALREIARGLALAGATDAFLTDFSALGATVDDVAPLLGAPAPQVRYPACEFLSSRPKSPELKARFLEVLLELADSLKDWSRVNVLHMLLGTQEPRALERVAADGDQLALSLQAMNALGPTVAYERLGADVRRYLDARAAGRDEEASALRPLVMAVLMALRPQSDPRWQPLALDIVGLGDVAGSAEYTLRLVDRPLVIERLVKLALSDRPTAIDAVGTLGILREASAAPAIADLLKRWPADRPGREVVLRALAEMGHHG